MSDEEIQFMIMALISHADYDLAKALTPRLAEDPEFAQETMKELIEIAKY